jgi:hypothetical protein
MSDTWDSKGQYKQNYKPRKRIKLASPDAKRGIIKKINQLTREIEQALDIALKFDAPLSPIVEINKKKIELLKAQLGV